LEWSRSVEDYYPVSPRPRWGYGLPAHSRIQAALEAQRATYEESLAALARHRAALRAIPHDPDPLRPGPFWNNIFFSTLDAASLVGFLLARRPRLYLEVGSGHSTLFARHAITNGQLQTALASIDPNPRANIDALCDHVIRRPLEDCDPAIFDQLAPGDLLFLDGSHRVFTNSDVTVFFFDILPRLKPGILVHLHDIFLPADYTPAWNRRLYSEQYLLGAMLLCAGSPFRVVLPNYFVCSDADLGARARALLHNEGAPDIPFWYNNGAGVPGVSFWIETKSQPASAEQVAQADRDMPTVRA
jgi:hypothetical protein